MRKRVEVVVGQGRYIERECALESGSRGLWFEVIRQGLVLQCFLIQMQNKNQGYFLCKRKNHHLAWLKSVRKVLCKIQLYLEWLLHKTNYISSEEAKSCQLLLLLDARYLQASFTVRQESSCTGHCINTMKTQSLHYRLCSLIHERVDVYGWTNGEWKETRKEIS